MTIDDEMEPGSIVEILEDLIGRSNLKSVNIKQVFSVDEALVVAAMLDMEKKANLRALLMKYLLPAIIIRQVISGGSFTATRVSSGLSILLMKLSVQIRR